MELPPEARGNFDADEEPLGEFCSDCSWLDRGHFSALGHLKTQYTSAPGLTGVTLGALGHLNQDSL